MRPVSVWLLSDQRRYYTWVYEFIFAGTLLAVVTALTTDWHSPRAVIISLAAAVGVFCALGHAKVGSRMSEEQEAMPSPTISCYRMAERYWVLKEVAWFTAFVVSGMYPALVGNFLFILYPVWRKVHVETRKSVRLKPA